MENRAIVYRLQPNKDQNILLHKTFGCGRFVYNKVLEKQQELYENGGTFMSKTAANNFCNRELKTAFPFLKEVDKFALTNAVFHLDAAYQRFFKGDGGFPKFKSKRKARLSYTTNFTNGNIEVGDNYVKLPKLGKVRAVIHRPAPEGWTLKSATVSENRDGTYQVSVLYEYETVPVAAVPADKAVILGIDYKSDGLYEDSNGDVCGMPHFFKESQTRLAKAQRKLDRMVEGSHNYERQKRRVAKIHRRIANQRKDFLHKKSSAITKQYDIVCTESLDMRAMSNKSFGNGKATMDNGYGMFLSMLEYKLAAKGGQLVRVDRWFPSSQKCSRCGVIHPEMKNLKIRKMYCQCGNVIDRDYNAALNIRAEGMRLLSA